MIASIRRQLMENENKQCEHKGGCGKALAIIAIILSIISIVASAFTLGVTLKDKKDCDMPCINNECPMQGNMQKPFYNNMPMWPMNGFGNRMNDMNKYWQNNDKATSSNARKRKVGGYSPYNKAYDKKPIQDIDRDQSPQEYKTYNAPDDTYGEKLKEREKLRKEKRESIAARETTNAY